MLITVSVAFVVLVNPMTVAHLVFFIMDSNIYQVTFFSGFYTEELLKKCPRNLDSTWELTLS